MPHPVVSTPRYEQTLADYAPLLEREIPAELLSSRIEYISESLTLADSKLSPEDRETLARRGFVPVASVTGRGPFLETEAEWWVDEDGATVLEVALAPPSLAGKHFLSTYYSDGTLSSLGPSDSILVSDDRRIRLPGVDALDKDITTALADRAERTNDDRRPLLAVDLPTVQMRCEFFARHFPPDLRLLLHMDAIVSRTDRTRERDRRGMAVIGVLLLINFATGWPPILATGTAVITIAYLLFLLRRFLTPDRELRQLETLAEKEANRLNIPPTDGSSEDS